MTPCNFISPIPFFFTSFHLLVLILTMWTGFEAILLAGTIHFGLLAVFPRIQTLCSLVFLRVYPQALTAQCCRQRYFLFLTRDTHLMQQFIYYYKQIYMFRASICPSSGVLGCTRIILLHMVSSTMCCGWGSEEPVCSLVHWCKCTRLHTGSSDSQPQHLVLDTIWSSMISIQPNTPEDGHIDVRNI